MLALLGCLFAMSLAQPSGDPRTIAPAANRPEIVAPGGDPAKAKVPKVRSPRGKPVSDPPKTDPPKTDPPRTKADPDPDPDPHADPEDQRPRERRRNRRRRRDPDPDAEEPLEPEEPEEPAESTGKCFPDHGRCWALSVAGITTASVGVGMIGAGVGFMLAPQFPIPDEPTFNRSLRAPGVALIAVGAVTVVTGTLSLVAGQVVHKRALAAGRTARVRLTPGGLRW